MRPVIRATLSAALLICACSGAPAGAQSAQGGGDEDAPIAAWTLVGVDVAVADRWRGLVRIGHLGELDTAIAVAEAIFVATPALHLQTSYVHLRPTAAGVAGVSLTRAGATWIPVRGRLVVDTRWLVERRAGPAISPSSRGRTRLRVSAPLLDPRWPRVFGTIEAVADSRIGHLETRVQLGATTSIGRWSIETYGLRRQLRDRPGVSGFGVTAAYRLGRWG